MKRAIIVHCWEGKPENFWYPWLKKQLEKRNYFVEVPEMPNTYVPEISTWVNHLKNTISIPDENLSLIGHSIGCQTIIRYLESLPENIKIDKVVLVASWLLLTNLEKEKRLDAYQNKTQEEIARPWIEIPIDWEKVKPKANKYIVILSKDDPYVPYEISAKHFKELLGAEIILLENRGHFDDENMLELPETIEAFN